MNAKSDSKSNAMNTVNPRPALNPGEGAAPMTYEIYGYLEYIAEIPVGSTSVTVHFSGGSLTGYGASPATMTTSDPVMKHIIEHSQLFLSGKIRKKMR